MKHRLLPLALLALPALAGAQQHARWGVADDPAPPDARALTEREAALASQAWGTLRRGLSVDGQPLKIADRTFSLGVGGVRRDQRRDRAVAERRDAADRRGATVRGATRRAARRG